MPQGISKYNVIKQIGRGGNATVSLVRHKETNHFFACKTLPKLANNDINKEIEIMRRLQEHSSHVVALHEVVEDNYNTHIIMEHCQGGDIYEYMNNSKPSLSERDVRNIIKECLVVVAQCHDMDIIHNDIKPQNFMLAETHNLDSLRLIDFGISTEVADTTLYTMKQGTPLYMAPECLESKICKKSDVWSVGVMTYLLLSGHFPFNDKQSPYKPSMYKIWNSVLNDDLKFPNKYWADISGSAKNFIQKLLTKSPNDRFTTYEALAHPWITMHDEQFDVNKTIGAMVVENINRYKNHNIIMRTMFEDFVEVLMDKLNSNDRVNMFRDGDTSLYDGKKAIISMNSDRLSYILHVLRDKAASHNKNITKDDFKAVIKRLNSTVSLDAMLENMESEIDMKVIITSQIDWDTLLHDSTQFESFLHDVFSQLDRDDSGVIRRDAMDNNRSCRVVFNKSVMNFEEFYTRVKDIAGCDDDDPRVHGGAAVFESSTQD
jgi:calcium-dependent protein kinase